MLGRKFFFFCFQQKISKNLEVQWKIGFRIRIQDEMSYLNSKFTILHIEEKMKTRKNGG